MSKRVDKLAIAFDVNNTLSREQVRRLFLALDRKKCYVIVWSSLGQEYAKKYCEGVGLEADEYANKQVIGVDIALDDIPESIHSAKVVLGVY